MKSWKVENAEEFSVEICDESSVISHPVDQWSATQSQIYKSKSLNLQIYKNRKIAKSQKTQKRKTQQK